MNLLLRKIGRFSNLTYRFSPCVFVPTARFSDILNEQISKTFPELRVVFTDENGDKAWKIMKRAEALQFAKRKALDLVLGK